MRQPREDRANPRFDPCSTGVALGSSVARDRISDVAMRGISSAWPETCGCPPLNCAPLASEARTQLICCNAEWLRLTSTPKRSLGPSQRQCAICNASVLCANRISDVHGISRDERRWQRGIVIAQTRARSRPLMECRGARGASGSRALKPVRSPRCGDACSRQSSAIRL